MDYKVGDIVKHIKEGNMAFGKIEKITDGKIWCHWSERVVKEPKTLAEFNAIRKRSILQWVLNDSKNLHGIVKLDINKRIS